MPFPEKRHASRDSGVLMNFERQKASGRKSPLEYRNKLFP